MTIENIVYKVKEKKVKFNLFLGAGASVSSKMPLASEVIDDILTNYADNSDIKNLGKKSYVDVVSVLGANERKELFENYISNTHISVTYLYLAELYKLGYIKYIFTTNFDDLILRALALKGIFPPIYDMTSIEEFSSSKPSEGAVIFLHGRHNGEWQMNTEQEMKKVKDRTKVLFNKIEDNRWIVVGYSGDDLVFDSLSTYCTRFNEHLYWIGYKNSDPSRKLSESLFKNSLKQAHYIKGYDSDSFFKELYIQLEGKSVPEILSKPFTTMFNIYNGVVDIDEKLYPKESLFLGMAKSQIASMTSRFEGKIDDKFWDSDNDYLMWEIYKIIQNREFNKERIIEIEEIIKNSMNLLLFPLLGEYYREYGLYKFGLSQKSGGVQYLLEAVEYYEKSEFYFSFFKGMKAPLYSNWFISLFRLYRKTNDKIYLTRSLEIAEKSVEEDPNYPRIYFNRGCVFIELSSPQNIDSLKKAIIDFEKAIELDNGYVDAWENCGICYFQLSTVEDKVHNFRKSHDMFIGAYKRGSISINLIHSCIIRNELEEAIGYLEAFAEKDVNFIKRFLSEIILNKPFDALKDDKRIEILKNRYLS